MNIRNLINPLLLLKVEANKVTLTETENLTREQTLQEVIITQLPNNTIAYSTDIKLKDKAQKDRKLYNEYLHVPSPLLTKQEGENHFWIDGSEFCNVKNIDKRSDGIIIYRNDENELSVIICDLKSKKFSLQECLDKFITDKLFLDYLLSILSKMFKQNLTIRTIKYVIFYLETDNEKLNPRTTKENSQKIEVDTMKGYEELVLKISFDKIHSNYIEWDKIINYQ